MTRRLTAMSLVPPTRRNVRRSSTRSSFTWSIGASSPISSRNSVPPFAISMRPSFWARASVNAPLLVAEQLGLQQFARDGRHS
jgi:hypothetical protein